MPLLSQDALYGIFACLLLFQVLVYRTAEKRIQKTTLLNPIQPAFLKLTNETKFGQNFRNSTENWTDTLKTPSSDSELHVPREAYTRVRSDDETIVIQYGRVQKKREKIRTDTQSG